MKRAQDLPYTNEFYLLGILSAQEDQDFSLVFLLALFQDQEEKLRRDRCAGAQGIPEEHDLGRFQRGRRVPDDRRRRGDPGTDQAR